MLGSLKADLLLTKEMKNQTKITMINDPIVELLIPLNQQLKYMKLLPESQGKRSTKRSMGPTHK